MALPPPSHPATSRDLSEHQNDLARSVQDHAAQLASELADTSLLHEVSSELIGEVQDGILYDKIVDAAIAIMRSDFGSMQMLVPGAGSGEFELDLLVGRNFSAGASRFWQRVTLESAATCGIALRSGERVVSPDVRTDPRVAAEDRAIYASLGIVSVQSTPLITRTGRLIGMLSTHRRDVNAPTPHQLRLLDILARQAADLLERNQTDAALRERESLLAGQTAAMQAAMNGAPLAVSLGELVRAVTEQLGTDARAAFYLADEAGKLLHHLVGMSDDYAAVTDGIQISAESVACGLAAATGQAVLTADVLDDPRWKPWLWVAQQFGYRACWSFPIKTPGGSFIGTLSLYWANPTQPTRRHLELAARITATAAIIISRDIEAAERRRVEDALHDSDRRKDEFLAMLAHELRNPLGVIRNASHLLRNGIDAASASQCVTLIERQAIVLGGLVDDLLDVSRITRGLVTLRQETCDVTEVVRHALASLRTMVDEKGHQLELTTPSRALHVVGDPVRIEQVVVNLIANAVKYTDPNGHIAVKLGARDGWITLTVRDDGIGMSPEVAERVFDLFSQAESGLARSRGGLGVGLTIVRRLVELHGGSVTANSDGLGTGSEFVVRLPQAQPVAADAAHAPANRQHEAMPDARHVLVVDDREDCATSMAHLLRSVGHRVGVARDGSGALSYVASMRPDIVLLDLGLPDIDGYEVARRIRSGNAGDAMALIAVSGYGQPEDIRRAHEAGFDRHFVKPVDPESLIDAMRFERTA